MEPQSLPFRLSGRHSQPLLSPQALDARVIHVPALFNNAADVGEGVCHHQWEVDRLESKYSKNFKSESSPNDTPSFMRRSPSGTEGTRATNR